MWENIEHAAWIATLAALILSIVVIIVRELRRDKRRRKLEPVPGPSPKGRPTFWSSLKKSRPFKISLGLIIALLAIFGGAFGYQTYQQAQTTIPLSYKDFHQEDVTVNEEFDKAIVYGSMAISISVPRGKTRLTVEIAIPSDGWGEGLAGPSGSAAQIEVDGQVKSERITDDMNHHHGWYYKYESGDHFSNTFDVTGKDKIVLTIRMVGGAHLDFKQAKLTFE